MGPRALVAVLVIQTLAIGLLAYGLIDVSGKLQSISIGSIAPQPVEGAADTGAAQDDGSAAGFLTESRLRRIIAEELKAGMSGISSESMPPGAEPDVGTAEQSDRIQRIEQEIEYHLSVGSISTADMEALQARIATLEPAVRKRMLNKLVSAMNAGQIDGRL